MRSAVLVAVFLALCQTAFSNDFEREARILEDTISNFTDCLLGKLDSGVEECDVPSFNPLKIDEGNVELGDFNINNIQGSLAVSGLELAGITAMQYATLSGSITLLPPGYRVRATPTFSNIVGSTRYTLQNFNYAGLEVFGEGSLSLNCNGLAVYIDVHISILGDLSGTSISFSTSIESCPEFEITGVNNDKALSQSITASVLENANAVIQQLNSFINDVLVGIVKQLLNNLTRGLLIRADDDTGLGCVVNQCM